MDQSLCSHSNGTIMSLSTTDRSAIPGEIYGYFKISRIRITLNAGDEKSLPLPGSFYLSNWTFVDFVPIK